VGQAGAGLEVADGQLADSVAAVVGVHPGHRSDAVGDQGVVAPGGKQQGLVALVADPTHDQPVAAVAGLGHLRQAAWHIWDLDPGRFRNGGDRGAHNLCLAHRDRVAHPKKDAIIASRLTATELADALNELAVHTQQELLRRLGPEAYQKLMGWSPARRCGSSSRMRPRPPASPSPHRQPRNPRKPSTVRNGQRGSLHPRQQPVPRLLGDAVSSLQGGPVDGPGRRRIPARLWC